MDLKLDDPERAPEVAKAVAALLPEDLEPKTWIEDNRNIYSALKMERIVSLLTVGLILLVSGLNIFTTLTMMVMEKNRDIAVLLAMGARREQIRNIFLCEGLLIGGVGTAIGLVLGYATCGLAGYYHWPRLDEQVYELSYVHFDPHLVRRHLDRCRGPCRGADRDVVAGSHRHQGRPRRGPAVRVAL